MTIETVFLGSGANTNGSSVGLTTVADVQAGDRIEVTASYARGKQDNGTGQTFNDSAGNAYAIDSNTYASGIQMLTAHSVADNGIAAGGTMAMSCWSAAWHTISAIAVREVP